jgi:hypothetical protein
MFNKFPLGGRRVNLYELFRDKRVEARYRAGHACYAATGTLTRDSGSSIVIEDHFVQNGKAKMMRVEIPYECILGVAELGSDSCSEG